MLLDTIDVDYSINSPADMLSKNTTSSNRLGEQPTSLTDIIGTEPRENIAVDSSINVDPTEQMDKLQNLKNTKAALSVADSVVDIFNAQNKYSAVSEANRINIFNSKMLANQAAAQGYQQGIYARSQGKQAADTALLSMAAQGQDVNAGATQKLEGSYEAVGIYNQMQEEINGMRQALGYEMKAIEYQRQTNAAEFQRNMTFLQSAGKIGVALI